MKRRRWKRKSTSSPSQLQPWVKNQATDAGAELQKQLWKTFGVFVICFSVSTGRSLRAGKDLAVGVSWWNKEQRTVRRICTSAGRNLMNAQIVQLP